MNFELIPTQWFNEDALRLPDYKVGRVNYGNGRSYVRLTDGELESPFRLYTSLTTAINTCAPMEDALLQWYCRLGYEEARHQVILSQHYGTLMHILIGDFLVNNFFDFETIEEKVQAYLSDNNYYDIETQKWADKLKYDLAAFIHFTQEHEIQPLGIEYVLLSERGFGTLIDLVCKMKIEEKGFFGEVYKSGERKGEPKETKQEKFITAIINFKSGRHAFYRSNGIQCVCEKQLWEENFPDIKIDACFNWSPKEWIVFPDYNLKDWTNEIQQEEIDSILSLAEVRFASKAINKKYISITGKAFKHKPIASCIQSVTAEDYCRIRYTDLLGQVPDDSIILAELDSENDTIIIV